MSVLGFFVVWGGFPNEKKKKNVIISIILNDEKPYNSQRLSVTFTRYGMLQIILIIWSI